MTPRPRKVTSASLYLHKRLRKLGGWRTSEGLCAHVEIRADLHPDLAGMRHKHRCVVARLNALRAVGLVKHRVVVEQNRHGTMVSRHEWKAVRLR